MCVHTRTQFVYTRPNSRHKTGCCFSLIFEFRKTLKLILVDKRQASNNRGTMVQNSLRLGHLIIHISISLGVNKQVKELSVAEHASEMNSAKHAV